jgi:septal ring factor EnvC (AmiA/AmiB activator)
MNQTAESRSTEQQLQSEIDTLRTRVAALESELVEVQSRANAAVAKWQERAYWLDRLHLDLNKLMERPGANEARLALRAIRAVFWRVRRIKRRLLGS